MINLETIRRISHHIVPVLCYHRVTSEQRVNVPGTFIISTSTFRRDIRLLLDCGLKPKLLSLPYNLENACSVNSKKVIITFDDGFEDTYTHAFPILEEFRLPATVFVVAGDVGKKKFMQVPDAHPLTWMQIKEMHNAGITIGSHTWSHRNLTSLSDDDLLSELTRSKKTIEDNIGASVKHFAYPYGIYNSRIAELVKSIGYETASGLELAHGGRYGIRRIVMTDAIKQIEAHFIRTGYHLTFHYARRLLMRLKTGIKNLISGEMIKDL